MRIFDPEKNINKFHSHAVILQTIEYLMTACKDLRIEDVEDICNNLRKSIDDTLLSKQSRSMTASTFNYAQSDRRNPFSVFG